MHSNRDAQLVDIATLDNAIEAQLISSILDQREIPYRLQSFYDTAYDGLFQFQKGWGKLFAAVVDKPEILRIIDEVRSQNNSDVDTITD
jgi:hypothetical protein